MQFNEKGNVKIHWNVDKYDYSLDKKNEIISVASKKYGIPKGNISLDIKLKKSKDKENESLVNQVTSGNIQDPEFQKKLFLEYLNVKGIKDYDFKAIDEIDNDINSKIDYVGYDKQRIFAIKWIKWSNFESYGTNNRFDFSSLNGLVLLNGEPANQSGKTTFAVDLLHFLLFGKSGKCERTDDLFNYTLDDETTLSVEGCILVNDEEFVIERILTRPEKSKRTAKSRANQKAHIYRKIGNSLEDYCEYVEDSGQDVRQTNKIIRDMVGREDDFDLMMCITGSNLDELINEKPTERGRLFSRWIGLLPLEKKDEIARQKFNEDIKPNLKCNIYNKEELKEEIEAYQEKIDAVMTAGKQLREEKDIVDKAIEELEKKHTKLISSKKNVDDDVMKLDITTIRTDFKSLCDEGVLKKGDLNRKKEEINNIGDIDFSVDEYNRLVKEKENLISESSELKGMIKSVTKTITTLKKDEVCPTCGRKLDNKDNSRQISEKQKELDELSKNKDSIEKKANDIQNKIDEMKTFNELFTKKNNLTVEISALEARLEVIKEKCNVLKEKKKEYDKNSKAIDENNKLDIEINNTYESIKAKREESQTLFKKMTEYGSDIKTYKKCIDDNEKKIKAITEDEKVEYNWELYLDMVGKNGISKMVLRETIPYINIGISNLLDDVCDFDLDVEVNHKNEVEFLIVRNGVSKSLDSGSGFEKTASAIALRSVLAEISTISKMNFIVFDEILGRVASENYDKMKLLYDRIAKGYDFIFHITHINEVKEWHENIVTVVKSKEGVSRLKEITNIGKLTEDAKKVKRENKKIKNTTKK